MDSFTALGDLMLNTAVAVCACLAESSVAGAPDVCSTYWSIPPDDFYCDCDSGGFLAVWLEGIGPTNVFPQPFNAPVQSAIGPVRAMANIAVRLVRPCWPGQTVGPDGQANLPSRVETEGPSLSLAMDASVVFCCLLDDFTSQSGDSLITGGPCTGVRMGLLTPDRNRSKCAGFTVRYTVDLGSCCIPVGGS